MGGSMERFRRLVHWMVWCSAMASVVSLMLRSWSIYKTIISPLPSNLFDPDQAPTFTSVSLYFLAISSFFALIVLLLRRQNAPIWLFILLGLSMFAQIIVVGNIG
jgi:hypothetical protein